MMTAFGENDGQRECADPAMGAMCEGTRVARRSNVAENPTSIAERRRRIEDLVMQIESEFLETPGLKLTIPEGQRRFGVDEITCVAVLDALVDSAVLVKTRDRVYARLFPHAVAA